MLWHVPCLPRRHALLILSPTASDRPNRQVVEIPKQIALASVAMRVQHRTGDEFFSRCSNKYMALGGVLYADLLTLPPPAKKVKQWVIRQVGAKGLGRVRGSTSMAVVAAKRELLSTQSHYQDGSVRRRDRQVGGSPSVRSDGCSACPCCVSKACTPLP